VLFVIPTLAANCFDAPVRFLFSISLFSKTRAFLLRNEGTNESENPA
jgi:hypothetical protein